MKRPNWWTGTAILGAASLTVALLAWRCLRDPELHFLPGNRRAEWILFPSAVEGAAHRVASLDSIFRREFTLKDQPRVAQLSARGAKRLELKINGISVGLKTPANWKFVSNADVSGFLKAGTNIIEARVFNDDAPPLLWLVLRTDELTLRTDSSWPTFCAGSAWRTAVLASTPRLSGPGNVLAGGEEIVRVWPRTWPAWVVFGAVAFIIGAACRWWFRHSHIPAGRLSRPVIFGSVLLISGLWMLLFWNNTQKMPFSAGFDSRFHLEYIKYIQEHRVLPLPTRGFEMFQPPLYYMLSAVALSSFGLSISDTSSVLVLRALTMLFGIAHFTLVLLCMRLFFADRIVPQLLGLMLAAFLPMQLYLAHYVTNECLAATLVTASVYFGLRVLRSDDPSLFEYISLGACTGLALLAKTSSFLLLPPLLLALTSRLRAHRSLVTLRLRNLGVMLAICVAISAWHYLRIWYHFGTPFLGNWDPTSGFNWWQDPGYRTAADYIRAGRSLIAPLFSGFNGLIDGIYSTLWGDALCGGVSDLNYRPPWNYEAMVGGYVLALLPTLMILVGAVSQIIRFARKPSAEWFMLYGLSAAVAVGIIFMTLKVPSYAQVKSFYGLSMLVPLCFFGAIGWDVITRGRILWQSVVGTILLVWAFNSFNSFWIRSSASQHVYAALRLKFDGKLDAAALESAAAMNHDRANATARRCRASILDDLGRSSEALEEAKRAVELGPTDSACHLQLAMTLTRQSQISRAIDESRRALVLGPENSAAYNLLVSCLIRSQRAEEAIDIGRDGLATSPFSAELHYVLAVALGNNNDLTAALGQFGYALLLRPNWADANKNLRLALRSLKGAPDGVKRVHEAAQSAPDSPTLLNELAWLLATDPDSEMRNGDEALHLAERACALTHRKLPALLITLATAYAETGKFADAISTAEEALSLARASNAPDVEALCRNLLAYLRENRPYREERLFP